MYHVCAFTKASVAGTQNEQVPGVSDGWATLTSGNNFQFSRDVNVLASYVNCASVFDAVIDTPSMRVVSLPHVQPTDLQAIGTSLPAISHTIPTNLRIPQWDEVTLRVTSPAVAADRVIGALFVGEVPGAIPQGNVYSIFGSTSFTATAYQWTPFTPAFQQNLPYGEYSIVGMDIFQLPGLARIQFPNGGMRPGCLGRSASTSKPLDLFRFGRMGEFGRFNSNAIPQMEAFAAGGAYTVYYTWDVIKLR